MTTVTIKRAARAQAQYAMKVGRLERQPCEVCGCERTDAHHDDYDQPLNIRWLCRLHHLAEHHDLILATRAKGERHGHVKLTDAQVAEIRARHKPGIHPARKTGGSSTELAREFGITRQYVYQLTRGDCRASQ